MNGIIVIDKQKEYTSFDVVAVMRRLLKQKKVGHTGTLDPMATGVLPILVGNATKAQSLLPDTDKTYLASFELGITTDTLDSTGNVFSTCSFSVSREELTSKLTQFCGDILQIPPMYSAVKQKGKRLYELAREGITVEREKRPVTIRKISLCEFDEANGCGKLEITCSKGTYIRTLCADLGDALGCGAIMTGLRRTEACGFPISSSITLEQAKKLAEEGNLEDRLISVSQLFAVYPDVHVTKAQAVRFQNGGGLSLDRVFLKHGNADEQRYRVFGPKDSFLGLGMVSHRKEELSVLQLFRENVT